MNSSEVKEKIKFLRKECEDKKHERKVLATDYEKQKEMVKKSGSIALITFLVHYVLLVPVMDSTKHATIAGMARYLSPFLIILLVASFGYFLVKGFDLFANADNKYSEKFAKRFGINRMSEELNHLNEVITMFDVEINKLENELFESGDSFDINDDTEKATIVSGKMLDRAVVKRTVIEKPKVVLPNVEEKNDTIIKNSKQVADDLIKNIAESEDNKSNIDDIFSGLDDLALDDNDDEFESSSDMWEKDAMRRFSRY